MLKTACSVMFTLFVSLTLRGQTDTPVSCDTWVALPDATSDASVILAKNSDRPSMEAQVLVHMPRANHADGEKVKCTYIDIPQTRVTYEHIGSKIWWAFGYEHGMNEYGVAIGNEAEWSREPYQWGDGLLGMDLLRLGLERGKTAYESMHVIIDLIQRYEYVDENCARIEKEYKMLNEVLPVQLETVGVKYLFVDFLTDWSNKKGVPLPLEGSKGSKAAKAVQ